jgi:phosphoglycolate phosphatase-like HAD superfamily hydrolase
LTTIVDTFRDHIAIILEKGVEFFPRVLNFLNSAKSNNFFTAIATNKPLALASQLVLSCELNELIDLTIGVGELLPKPNPSMISYCSEYFRVTDTTMFVDRVEDMQAAKLAGARAVGVRQGFHTRNQLLDSGANQVFPDFVQIHQFFDLNIWEK